VEKGIKEALEHGVFAGYPVVDVCVRATDGKSHPVDSNETSFRIAGRQAFKDAFLKARPCLLEPIVDLFVEVPATSMGDITGDLNSRRGRIAGIDSLGSLQVIKAQIPLRELLDAAALDDGGRGLLPLHLLALRRRAVEDRAGAGRPLQAEGRGVGEGEGQGGIRRATVAPRRRAASSTSLRRAWTGRPIAAPRSACSASRHAASPARAREPRGARARVRPRTARKKLPGDLPLPSGGISLHPRRAARR
jgi:hypothetical protein